nr:unnamed protein product [Spirometra erinaceieuropaei]
MDSTPKTKLKPPIQKLQQDQQTRLVCLKTALFQMEQPLKISKLCLLHREARLGVDQVKDAVERALTKLDDEMAKHQNTLASLKLTLKDKSAYQKLCETRINERNRRQNMEACYDSPMSTLNREAFELQKFVEDLQRTIREMELQLTRLTKTRNAMEGELNIKERSIQIDHKECYGLRKTSLLAENSRKIFQMPIPL